MPPLLQTMRPRQWPKNLFVFAALLFDGRMEDFTLRLTHTLLAFVLLCLMSSAVYIMNDLADIESDRQHPLKRFRPIPAGKIKPATARTVALVLATGSLIAGFLLSVPFGFILLTYLFIQFAYTFYLKHIVILDVMAVASGFVLRVAAGVVVIEVLRFSPWLYVCTGLGALFLALGKRRHELMLLGGDAGNHRAILQEYSLEFVDRLISVVLTSVVVAYSLYTFLAEGLPENHTMMLTIPIVIYILFRLLYLMVVRGGGGTPEDFLLQDRPLQVGLLLWVTTAAAVIYILS